MVYMVLDLTAKIAWNYFPVFLVSVSSGSKSLLNPYFLGDVRQLLITFKQSILLFWCRLDSNFNYQELSGHVRVLKKLYLSCMHD